MARQKGIIKLLGTVGDITFYKAKEGFLAREKGGVDKSRIMNDSFQSLIYSNPTHVSFS
ncbi:hypothetical protein [Faecalibacter macacae]|uniref:hypothetical protein n=1 Tax=Faecalibacter macacae TaxID=1859289 RepID=UPI001E35B080|nr:hypothetical protein [Faecalibacter macacae]